MTSRIKPGIYPDHEIDGERFALLVVTEHDGALAMTAIHSTEFGPSIGGARFVRSGDVSEVGHLSKAMTEKCMAANIPAGGQKSVIEAPAEVIASETRKAHVLGRHVAAVVKHAPHAIFGPDMNTPESVMDLIAADPDLRDHVTGLSEKQNGLSIDKHGYTAIGLTEAVHVWSELTKQQVSTASIQGFGAVGAHAARLLSEDSVRIRAISNEQCAIIALGQAGIDAGAFFDAWRSGGDAAVYTCARARPAEVSLYANPSELFSSPAQVFVPAARTSCFGLADELAALRTENPDVRDVADLLAKTRMRLLVQGANHPLSERAEQFLEQRGVTVLIDFIVNCGGLIGCWVEWLCRHDGRPAAAAAAEEANRHIRQTIRENVTETVQSRKSARMAAVDIVERNRLALKRKRN